jgi:hypothetical protein
VCLGNVYLRGLLHYYDTVPDDDGFPRAVRASALITIVRAAIGAVAG